jgi:hypothetical protein
VLELKLKVRVTEVETGVYNRHANTRASPTEIPGRGADSFARLKAQPVSSQEPPELSPVRHSSMPIVRHR